AAACRWQGSIRERLNPAVDRALETAADLVPGLGEAQFRHLQQRYAKNAEEFRSDFLQSDLAERLEKSVERAIERSEQLYGPLDEAQKQVIAAGVAASPFDPQVWLAERQRRGRDIVQTLRKLVADKADREQRLAALRALAQRTEQSPDPVYRAYQQKLGDYNCALAAQIHNATTPAQRQRARERLKGWEEDLRALAAQPPA
ncbi:MAG: hypothetical protein H7Z19_05080, partial [Chitinophagaceae bacterium]|nr:hypothetical protein [Rubrivivax sp.]